MKLKSSCLAVLVLAGSLSVPLAQAATLDELKSMGAAPEKSKVPSIRANAVRTAALAYGLRKGMRERGLELLKEIESRSEYFDAQYQFSALVLPSGVLPPVTQESRNFVATDMPGTLRTVDVTNKIVVPERFVVPHWLDYLKAGLETAEPPKPHRSLLPTNAEEKQIWVDGVEEGWTNGIQSADRIFAANMSRLRRDWEGMLTSRMLMKNNQMVEPIVTKAVAVVSGNGHEMKTNDTLYRVAKPSELNLNTGNWKGTVYSQEWERQRDEIAPAGNNQNGVIKSIPYKGGK